MCSVPENGTKAFLQPPCVQQKSMYTEEHTWVLCIKKNWRLVSFFSLCAPAPWYATAISSNWPTSFSSAMISRNHSNTRGFRFSHSYRKEVKYDRADPEQMGLSLTKKVEMMISCYSLPFCGRFRLLSLLARQPMCSPHISYDQQYGCEHLQCCFLSSTNKQSR